MDVLEDILAVTAYSALLFLAFIVGYGWVGPVIGGI